MLHLTKLQVCNVKPCYFTFVFTLTRVSTRNLPDTLVNCFLIFSLLSPSASDPETYVVYGKSINSLYALWELFHLKHFLPSFFKQASTADPKTSTSFSKSSLIDMALKWCLGGQTCKYILLLFRIVDVVTWCILSMHQQVKERKW